MVIVVLCLGLVVTAGWWHDNCEIVCQCVPKQVTSGTSRNNGQVKTGCAVAVHVLEYKRRYHDCIGSKQPKSAQYIGVTVYWNCREDGEKKGWRASP